MLFGPLEGMRLGSGPLPSAVLVLGAGWGRSLKERVLAG